MGTWVLVLVLWTASGTAITNVPGFTGEHACSVEGKRWEGRGRYNYLWHCLEVKGSTKE